MTSHNDYVLGTRDDEMARLSRQHDLWRDECENAWTFGDIRSGSRVLDIGCGPGVATVDLANIVGESGRVVGLELSPRYVEEAAKRLSQCNCKSSVHVHDLMKSPLPQELRGHFDFTWSRWVSMFVSRPELIVDVAHDALVTGGCAIFHEYVEYESYALHPNGKGVSAFVRSAVHSFAEFGGNVNIGRRLPTLLCEKGFSIQRLRSIGKALRPTDPLWHWPAGFIRTYAPTLVERGQLSSADAAAAICEVNDAEASNSHGRAGAFIMPPTLLEIVARKDGAL